MKPAPLFPPLECDSNGYGESSLRPAFLDPKPSAGLWLLPALPLALAAGLWLAFVAALVVFAHQFRSDDEAKKEA